MKKEVEDIVLKPEDIIGECDVDSGQIMIIDPCYVLSDEKHSELVRERSKIGYPVTSTWMQGVVVDSGGDGTYKVFAKIDEKTKRIKSVTIEFDHANIDRSVELINKHPFSPESKKELYCEFCGTKEGKIKMIQDFGVCEKCERGGRI